MMKYKLFAGVLCGVFLINVAVDAGVERIDITERTHYLDGQSFGETGPYEKLSGHVYYTVDPAGTLNQTIVDLEGAPRNKAGLVEYSADILVLVPADRTKVNGTLIYEVNNRGGSPLLRFEQPSYKLLGRGYTIVLSGWIGELLPKTERLRLHAPVASESNKPIVGKVRRELVISQSGSDRQSVSGNGHGSYEPTDHGLKTATLTRRLRVSDPREAIDRSRFHLETHWSDYSQVRDGLPRVELVLEAGFEPGYIYELIYEAKNPIVQGLGFASVRDLVSYLRYDTSLGNPLHTSGGRNLVDHTIAFGASQSGRFLRMFLYEGFNEDGASRPVFDGVIPHVAGGGMGFFNHRFASPTHTNTQHETDLYPSDVFPFTYGEERDPFTGRIDGILKRARASNTVPKIMHTQTSAEYWHRAGSLTHTDPLGRRDSKIPPEVRIYAIGGAQHGSGSGLPASITTGQLARNHTHYIPILRALIVAMDAWISEDVPPPPSRYPRIDEGNLVSLSDGRKQWRPIPGVNYPALINHPKFADYGPHFSQNRIVTKQPPVLKGFYTALVPSVNADNIDRGMLLPPAVVLPLGTYTGWNLRSGAIGAEGALLRLWGGYIPFAKGRSEPAQPGDTRPTIQERYQNFDSYLQKYTRVAQRLVTERYLLQDDLDILINLAQKNKTVFD